MTTPTSTDTRRVYHRASLAAVRRELGPASTALADAIDHALAYTDQPRPDRLRPDPWHIHELTNWAAKLTSALHNPTIAASRPRSAMVLTRLEAANWAIEQLHTRP
ncbi:MAG: hypothetical protein AAF547_06480 [Actinomycetota bacterium]